MIDKDDIATRLIELAEQQLATAEHWADDLTIKPDPENHEEEDDGNRHPDQD